MMQENNFVREKLLLPGTGWKTSGGPKWDIAGKAKNQISLTFRIISPASHFLSFSIAFSLI